MEQWEFYYHILLNADNVAITLITAYCYCYFVKPFMKNKKTVWLVGAVYFIVMQFLFYMPWHISNFLAYSVGMLSGFIVMCFLERDNIWQKLFLSVTFFNIRWLSLAINHFCYKLLYWQLQPLWKSGQSIAWLFFIDVTITVVDAILSYLIMFLTAWILQRAFVYKKAYMSRKEMLMLIMPSLSAMLSYAIWKYFSDIYEADTGNSLFELYGKYDFLTQLHYAVSLLTILVMIIVFQNLTARQEEEKQNIFLQKQIEDMKNHIDEVEKIYHDIRCIRHDMRNHVMILENLCQKKEYEEAEKYLNQMTDVITDTEVKIASGNPVTDVILNEKQKEAKEKGIRFLCDFHYPENTKLNAFDVSVILGNAITNAIEAAQNSENPEISVLSYRKNNAFMIEITNSFSDELIYDEETGLLLTSKKDRENHGFGLINIRSVARKYSGDMDIVQDNGKFVLCVMLMLQF